METAAVNTSCVCRSERRRAELHVGKSKYINIYLYIFLKMVGDGVVLRRFVDVEKEDVETIGVKR